MEFIRQHADRNVLERITFLNGSVHAPQPFDAPHQEITRSVRESHGKEKDPALDFCTSISRHGGMIVSSHCAATRGHASRCPPSPPPPRRPAARASRFGRARE